MKSTFLLCLFLALSTLFGTASEVNPELKQKRWRAYWVTAPDASEHDYGVYHFRKQFKLAEKPAHYRVHVSADNRYQLFVNGTMVSLGPAQGDLFHWNYETIDLAPWLQSGDNTIAATVWNYGTEGPLAQISYRTAFILQGDTKAEDAVNTNPSWSVTSDKGYKSLKPTVLGYFVAPYGEVVNMGQTVKGWQLNGYDATGWKQAENIAAGSPKGAMSTDGTGWMLVPSPLPQMQRTLQRLPVIRKAEGVKVSKAFLLGKAPMTIPPHTHAVILFDNEQNTNAYVHLDFSKGKNATMALTYAESLYDGKTMEKGDRNAIDGKVIFGLKDSIIASGEAQATYASLNWKTFRYLQLSVETQEEPLVVNDLYGIYTGFPFTKKATFASSDPS